MISTRVSTVNKHKQPRLLILAFYIVYIKTMYRSFYKTYMFYSTYVHKPMFPNCLATSSAPLIYSFCHLFEVENHH